MRNDLEDNIEFLVKKGRDLAQRNFVFEAADCYNRAIKIKATQAADFAFQGQALAGLGDHIDALRLYDIAIEKGSSHVDTWNKKGISLEETGDLVEFQLDWRHAKRWFEEALNCYDKAIELDPGYPDAWNNRGVCLYSLGRYDEALNCFNEVIRLDSKSGDPWYNKSITLDEKGQRDAAEEAMEMAIALGVSPY